MSHIYIRITLRGFFIFPVTHYSPDIYVSVSCCLGTLALKIWSYKYSELFASSIHFFLFSMLVFLLLFFALTSQFKLPYLVTNEVVNSYRRHALLLLAWCCTFFVFLTPQGLLKFIKMRVKDRPQCYFDVELNRDPGNQILYSFQSRRLPQSIFRSVLNETLVCHQKVASDYLT